MATPNNAIERVPAGANRGTAAIAKPSDVLPTSPRKTRAGGLFRSRKPIAAAPSTVDSVHEVVEVDDADEPDDGQRDAQPADRHIERRRKREPVHPTDQDHDCDRDRKLHGEPVAGADRTQIVDQPKNGDRRHPGQEDAEVPAGTDTGYQQHEEARGNARHDPEPAPPGGRLLMRAPLVGDIEQPEPRTSARDQPGHDARSSKCHDYGGDEREDHEGRRLAIRSGAAFAKLIAGRKPSSRWILAAL